MKTPYPYFSHNSQLLPVAEAVVPLNSVEYSYGFGVYETLRVSKNKLYFPAEHCQRLMKSAEIIGLEHEFDPAVIETAIRKLLEANQAEACNVKVLLVGGRTAADANLYILCLNPLFPDRKLYKTGAKTISAHYERQFPHAKTLNMLPSYLAYRQARQADAYDALSVNSQGNITEGTRTNFFVIKDRAITSPPEKDLLLGVTRDKVLQVARQQGYEIIELDIPLDSLDQYDGAFLTSTSSKIMPIQSVDDFSWPETPAPLKELIQAFDEFLATV
jgi:branched-chain amino acid aminotransferase